MDCMVSRFAYAVIVGSNPTRHTDVQVMFFWLSMRSTASGSGAVVSAALKEKWWVNYKYGRAITHTRLAILILISGLDHMHGTVCWEWRGLNTDSMFALYCDVRYLLAGLLFKGLYGVPERLTLSELILNWYTSECLNCERRKTTVSKLLQKAEILTWRKI